MNMEKRLKKVTVIVLIVVGVLLIGAVILGVLNALVGNGEWTFGWTDYRYDESGYESGEGSIPSNAVTKIELDWIDGGVEIVPCQDAYISVSETAAEELSDSARLRWKVGADGTLSIKYRESSWFFGIGLGNREKKLTLRIPEKYFEQLTEIEISAASANVVVTGISVKAFDFEAASGSLVVKECVIPNFSAETVGGKIVTDGLETAAVSVESVGGEIDLKLPVCPNELDISTTGGNITLRLPADSSFALEWDTVGGKISYDLPIVRSGNRYVCGDAAASFDVETVGGSLTLVVIE